ncbi:MAG: hypothetical protein CVV61_07375 [Tenericutes bacterium HGW-Tenericutes-6]|nr:MAG: hypothetical protein CVV61_07375 [Tenericutes bacterium HGW-Tenericutes-6]
MRHIKTFDQKDYHSDQKAFRREAVRAIIKYGKHLLLIESDTYHELKFPGGGIEKNEDHITALKREVLEETGLTIIVDSIKPYGYVLEKRASIYNQDEYFHMTSYYYIVSVLETRSSSKLDPYEKKLGYHLCEKTLEEAILQNEKALKMFSDVPWIQRELYVLKDISKEESHVTL